MCFSLPGTRFLSQSVMGNERANPFPLGQFLTIQVCLIDIIPCLKKVCRFRVVNASFGAFLVLYWCVVSWLCLLLNFVFCLFDVVCLLTDQQTCDCGLGFVECFDFDTIEWPGDSCEVLGIYPHSTVCGIIILHYLSWTIPWIAIFLVWDKSATDAFVSSSAVHMMQLVSVSLSIAIYGQYENSCVICWDHWLLSAILTWFPIHWLSLVWTGVFCLFFTLLPYLKKVLGWTINCVGLASARVFVIMLAVHARKFCVFHVAKLDWWHDQIVVDISSTISYVPQVPSLCHNVQFQLCRFLVFSFNSDPLSNSWLCFNGILQFVILTIFLSTLCSSIWNVHWILLQSLISTLDTWSNQDNSTCCLAFQVPIEHHICTSFSCISDEFANMDFDASLGFPGEGPWSLTSANIDSFQSHPDCVQWDSDVIAIQESRLAKSNITDARHKALEYGKDIFYGNLLNEKKDKNGFFKVPHGGTACLASPACTRNFVTEDDVTGIWPKLQATCRISATWHQVLPKLRVLVFCFYGQASLAHDAHLPINQQWLEDIFLVAAQFGSIPILIAGDFQSDPDCYQAIVDAKALGFWFDPLVEANEQGEFSRPITFSQGGNFKNPSKHFSLIDGILMNDVALSALSEITVNYGHSKQHAPIKAVFQWPRVFQKGHVLVKPAAFDLTKISHPNGSPVDLNPSASQIWNDKYKNKFFQVDDNSAWKIVNDLAVDTLKAAGATYGRGPKQRGGKPTFKQVVCCPGQDRSGNAVSKLSCYLAKTFQLVTELRLRFSRTAIKSDDFYNTWNLQQKVVQHLRKVDSCKWWDPNLHLHEDALKEVLACLQVDIVKNRQKEKRKRIADWKRKMIEGTKSKQVDKLVFAWIKSKAQTATPNLIRDSDGDIITDPDIAMSEINNQWDQVFAANALHTDPMVVLKYAWPYVQNDRKVAELPPIAGCDLRDQAIRRKIDAAPGLDGWRTPEMKVLPTFVYDIAAQYFEQVESGLRQLPTCLVLARQIILDKKGDTPLQKRLISLLPIFLLCYTSLRYRQLQSWQQSQMPPQLFGGIRNRQMSQLQAKVRLSLDEARLTGNHIVGIKLDKAKCFDRLVPNIASALMIAFGVPTTVVQVFTQIYAKLKRLLSYKGWISTTPTTCANGVVQGDSLSLIAINVHMALWIKLIDKLPGMFAAVYVDDSYLWTRLDNCRILREAIDCTEQWDTLTGQLVNQNKSSTWASNTVGRKILNQQFPDMIHEKIVEVLGARLQTCNQKAMAWDQTKTQKIIRDLKSIKALPCPVAIKEHIIGLKISPQLSFAPHLSAVPKKDLKAVQDQLVSIIWKNRPMWRCRWLIIALLANPHRSEPFLARAFNCILETVTYLKACNPADRQLWQNLCNHSQIFPNSLCETFRNACLMLDVGHPSAFHLSFFNSEPVCFLDFGKKELKSLLKVVVRHRAYKFATDIKRKDIKPCNGVLNFPLTKKYPKTLGSTSIDGISLKSFWDSQMVGCTLTNDRKYKAGLCHDNLCRFCHAVPESLEHIVEHCPNPPFKENKPQCPVQCGPNFKLLGIVESTPEQVAFRLQTSHTSDIPIEIWNCNEVDNFQQLWTDGSCNHTDLFWETSGGYAIVNELGGLISSGPVHHVCLSSYSCELWAILWAFCTAKHPIECRTDSKTVCDQVRYLIDTHEICADWMHFEWWCFLRTVYIQRWALHRSPLTVTWFPAHVLEELPCELISRKLAQQFKTTWGDIFCNRKADWYAKKACREFAKSGNVNDLCQQISEWQHWLTLVSSEIAKRDDSDLIPQSDENHQHGPQLFVSPGIAPGELTLAQPDNMF